MALSKDTLKNLLDVMQKVSLAITAVSVALLSSFVLSGNIVEKAAQPELERLLGIRDAFPWDSPTDIIERGIIKTGGTVKQKRLTLQLRIGEGSELLRRVIISFPSVTYKIPSGADPANSGLKEVQTLADIRKIWNAVVSTTIFHDLETPVAGYGCWGATEQKIGLSKFQATSSRTSAGFLNGRNSPRVTASGTERA